jgi:glycosyltransferase involved in cell wall biosynthesis
MNILLIHNHYGGFSGETAVLEKHLSLLKKEGHEIHTYTRSSAEINSTNTGKIKAFFTGVYNPSSNRKVKHLLDTLRPDLVHIHNLYPLISPSILKEVRKAGIPVVMTVHNYRLICPNGLFYNRHDICELCSSGREWNCILQNCEQSLIKSIGYAARNAWARISGSYRDNVSAYLCLTEFQKRKLVENGFSEERCHIIPNFLEVDKKENTEHDNNRKGFLFIGRLNSQKGVDILIRAAKQLPSISFRLAGSADHDFIDTGNLPSNVEWLGIIDNGEKKKELQNAIAMVFTSRSYEGFPMVFLEAMEESLPVIAPDLAGYPEIIRNGRNGLLFKPQDVNDLTKKIKYFNDNKQHAFKYGHEGRVILESEYSQEVWYDEYLRVVQNLMKKV